MLATVGGSPTRASEVALLAVEDTKELLSSQPSNWQTLRKSSKVEVHPVREMQHPCNLYALAR